MRRRKRGGQRGAAAVEFALVLPLFLLLVLGTIDFGYFFFVSEVVTNAAREGARAGSVIAPSDPAGVAEGEAKLRAEQYLQNGGLQAQGVTAQAGPVNGVNAIRVDIAYPVGSVTGFLSAIMPTFSNAHAVMRWQ